MANVFWERWVKEYLPLLQTRSKRYHARNNLKIGDLVLVADENSSRGSWPLGIILAVNKGRGGLVRSARVKIGDHTKIRPVVKLCLLEASDTIQRQ